MSLAGYPSLHPAAVRKYSPKTTKVEKDFFLLTTSRSGRNAEAGTEGPGGTRPAGWFSVVRSAGFLIEPRAIYLPMGSTVQ